MCSDFWNLVLRYDFAEQPLALSLVQIKAFLPMRWAINPCSGVSLFINGMCSVS